jgi:MFS family permease
VTAAATVTADNGPEAAPAIDAWPSSGLAWGWVAALLVTYVFSFADRQILSLLVGPIRADLKLSDTEFSLLSGAAFAIFYTFLGLPFGRLADRVSRRKLVAAGAFFWSLMTMLSGFTRSFGQLFAARVGVGVGEAALNPAAFSMLADLFPPERRGRAFSVYSLGIYVGAGLAFGIGGVIVGAIASTPTVTLPLLGETASWHATFFAMGIPCLLLPLLLLALPEPERRDRAPASPSLGEAWRWMGARWRLLAPFCIGFGLMVLAGFAVLAWAPEFFVRAHGAAPQEAGVAMGIEMVVAGSVGVLAGGALSDRLTRAGRSDAVLIVGVIAAWGGLLPGLLFPLVPSMTLALILLALVFFFGAFASGAAPAALALITPNELRGQVSALYLLAINLIGIGLGPTVPALMTDFVFADERRIGWSLAIVGGVTAVLAAWLLQASRSRFRAAAAA